jgi:HK97 family phage prohead protease
MKTMSKNLLTTRHYNLKIRADNTESGIIEGVPIVFERETIINDWSGQFKEIIDRNALQKTDLKDVRLFVNHDTNKITLARSKNGKGTMQLSIEDDGLHMKAELDIENNVEAKSLYSAVKRGDMDGMSFMFRIDGEQWIDLDKDVPTRRITSISVVHEVSVVNFPAYQQTSVNARSAEETKTSILEEARKAFLEETRQNKEKELELEIERYNFQRSK